MTIRPLYDRIVVKRIEEKQQMQGGLHIPDSAKEKPQEAEVTAVGRGKRLEDGTIAPLDVKVGDRVLLGKYAGNEIKVDGQDLLIIREDEVLGIRANPSQAGESILRRKPRTSWQPNRSYTARIPARQFCAASTTSRTR